MKVEFRRDPAADAPYALICARSRTPQVEDLMQRLSDQRPITVCDDRGEVILEQGEIIRIYTENRRIAVDSDRGTFRSADRLYELEKKLDSNEFIRISNSEIVNRRRICGLDFSLVGTIRLQLKNGCSCYVSRRYVPRIRKAFEG